MNSIVRSAIRLAGALLVCGGCGNAEPALTSPTRPVSVAAPTQASEEPSEGTYEATVLTMDSTDPRCGVAIAFGEVTARTDDGRELSFSVACLEFTRPQMGPDAGDAPMLVVGTRYRFTLEMSSVIDRLEAVRIDVIR